MINLTKNEDGTPRIRQAGGDNELEAQEYMFAEFEKLGYEVSYHDVTYPTNDRVIGQTSKNVVAVKPSANGSALTIYVTAHVDSVAAGPGANDNASGSVGLLTIARAMKDVATNYNICFISFCGEEAGLLGSKAYVADMTDAQKAAALACYNMDMIATDDDARPYYMVGMAGAVNSTGENHVIRMAREAGLSLGYTSDQFDTIVFDWGLSDHYPFHQIGVPAIDFFWNSETDSYKNAPSTVEPEYHTAQDTFDANFSLVRFQKMVDAIALAVYNDSTANYVAVVGEGIDRDYYTSMEAANAAATALGTTASPMPHSHDGELYTALTSATDLTNALANGGNYYLDANLSLAGGTVSKALNLCLNGHEVNFTKVTYIKADVNITDCKNFTGLFKMVAGNGVLRVQSGTTTLGRARFDLDVGNQYHPAVRTDSSGAKLVFDGAIVQSNAKDVTGNWANGTTIELKSGTIENTGTGYAMYIENPEVKFNGNIRMLSSGANIIVEYGAFSDKEAPFITFGEDFNPIVDGVKQYYSIKTQNVKTSLDTKPLKISTGWAAAKKAANLDYIPFTSYDTKYEVFEMYGELYIGIRPAHLHDDVPFENEATSSIMGYGGSYYLANSISDFVGYVVMGDLYICLDGKSLTGNATFQTCLGNIYLYDGTNQGTANVGEVFFEDGDNSIHFNGGTYTITADDCFSVGDGSGTIYVDGASITAANGIGSSGILAPGGNINVVLTSGTITAPSGAYPVYHSGSGTLTMNGDIELVSAAGYADILLAGSNPVILLGEDFDPNGKTYTVSYDGTLSSGPIRITEGWSETGLTEIPFVALDDETYAVYVKNDELYYGPTPHTHEDDDDDIVWEGIYTAADLTNAFANGGYYCLEANISLAGGTVSKELHLCLNGQEVKLTKSTNFKADVDISDCKNYAGLFKMEAGNGVLKVQSGTTTLGRARFDLDVGTQYHPAVRTDSSGAKLVFDGAIVESNAKDATGNWANGTTIELKSGTIENTGTGYAMYLENPGVKFNGKIRMLSSGANIVVEYGYFSIADPVFITFGENFSPIVDGEKQYYSIKFNGTAGKFSNFPAEPVKLSTGWADAKKNAKIDYVPFVSYNDTQYAIFENDGELWYGIPPHEHDIDDEKYTQRIYAAAGQEKVNIYDTVINGGSFYLEGDGQFEFVHPTSDSMEVTNDLYLCLNGKVLDMGQMYVKGKINICNCQGSGKIYFDNSEDYIRLQNSDADLTIKNVTIEKIYGPSQNTLFYMYAADSKLSLENCKITGPGNRTLIGVENFIDYAELKNVTVYNNGTGTALNVEVNGFELSGYNDIKAENNADIKIWHENDKYVSGHFTLLGIAPDFNPAPEGKEPQTYTLALDAVGVGLLDKGPVKVTTGWSVAKEANNIDYIPFTYYDTESGYEVFEWQNELWIGKLHYHGDVGFIYIGQEYINSIISEQYIKLPEGKYCLEPGVTLDNTIMVSNGDDVHICMEGRSYSSSVQVIAQFDQGGELHFYDCIGTATMDCGMVAPRDSMSKVYLHGGKFTITPFGNQYSLVADNGGQLYVDGAIVTANNGDKVKFGTAISDNGKFVFSSGSITNTGTNAPGLYIYSGTYELSGPLTINGSENGGDIFFDNHVLLTITGKLTPPTGEKYIVKLDADVAWKISEGKPLQITTGFKTSGTVGNPFESWDPKYYAFIGEDGEVYLGVNHIHKIASGVGSDIIFNRRIDSVEALNSYIDVTTSGSSNVYTLQPGNYVVTTEMVEYIELSNIKIMITDEVNLCLYGNTLDLGTSFFQIGARSSAPFTVGTLNICDCTGNGKLTSKNANQTVRVYAIEAKLNLYSGTVENSNDSGSDKSLSAIRVSYGFANIYGGRVEGKHKNAIYIHDNGTCHVMGGTVTAPGTANNNKVGYGVRVDGGTFKLSGNPVITGGEAGIYLASGKTVTVAGVITGNYTVNPAGKATFNEGDKVQITTDWEQYSADSTPFPFSHCKDGCGVYELDTANGRELFFVKYHEHYMAVDTEKGSDVNTGIVTFDRQLSEIADLQEFYIAAQGDAVEYYGLTTGAYVLTADLEVNKAIKIRGEVELCLNGHKLDLNEYCISFVDENSKLSICDCKGGGKITSEHNKATILQGHGILNIYGGTIEHTVLYDKTKLDEEGNPYIPSAIHTSNTVNIYGGKIFAKHHGIYTIASSAVVKIYGGIVEAESVPIEGTTSYTGGSGIYASQCQSVYIGPDAEVTGRVGITALGGEVIVESAKIKAIRSDGIFIDKHTNKNTTGTVTVKGNCNIEGYFSGISVKNGTLNLSGGSTIKSTHYSKGYASIHLHPGQVITVNGKVTGTYTVTAEVTPTETAPVRITTGWNTYHSEDRSPFLFESHDKAYYVFKHRLDNELYLGVYHKHQIADGVGEEITFDCYIDSVEMLESYMVDGKLADGHYVLMANIDYSKNITISGNVDFCLNGYTLNLGQNQVTVSSAGALNVCDCNKSNKGNGMIKSTVSVNQDSGVIVNSGTFRLFSGTIRCNATDKDNVHGVVSTGNVYVYSGNIFAAGYGIKATSGNVHVSGGTIKASTTYLRYQAGVGIDCSGNTNVTISGGTVSGTIAGVNNTGSLTISGGTITATDPAGYGVKMSSGTFNLSGAPEITGGQAGIYLGSGKMINIIGTITAPVGFYTVETAVLPEKGKPVQITTDWEKDATNKAMTAYPFVHYLGEYPVWKIRENDAAPYELYLVIPEITTVVLPEGTGTLVPSAEAAKGGTQVTLTATPNEGYKLVSLEISYVLDGIERTETLTVNNGTATFTMPAAHVTATAVFRELHVHVRDLGTGSTENPRDYLRFTPDLFAQKVTGSVNEYFLDQAWVLSGDLIIESDKDVHLCLNGHTLTFETGSLIIRGANVYICDCQYIPGEDHRPLACSGGIISQDGTAVILESGLLITYRVAMVGAKKGVELKAGTVDFRGGYIYGVEEYGIHNVGATLTMIQQTAYDNKRYPDHKNSMLAPLMVEGGQYALYQQGGSALMNSNSVSKTTDNSIQIPGNSYTLNVFMSGGTAEIYLAQGETIDANIFIKYKHDQIFRVRTAQLPTMDKPVEFAKGFNYHYNATGKQIFSSVDGYGVAYCNEVPNGTNGSYYLVVPTLDTPLDLYLWKHHSVTFDHATLLDQIFACDPEGKYLTAEDITVTSLEYRDLQDMEFTNNNNGESYTFGANADSSAQATLVVNYTVNETGKVFAVKVKVNAKVYDVNDSIYVLDTNGTVKISDYMFENDILPGTKYDGEGNGVNFFMEAFSKEEPALDEDGKQMVIIYADGDENQGLGNYGTFEISENGQVLTYELFDFMNGADEMYVILRAHAEGTTASELGTINPFQEVEMYKKLIMIPANVIYYEDNFQPLEDGYNDTNSKGEKVNQITVYGEGNGDKYQDPIGGEYGNDASYAEPNETGSGNVIHEIKVLGSGEVLRFKFKGTGLDIIGRTTDKSGSMSVQIWLLNEDGTQAKRVYNKPLDTVYNMEGGAIFEAPLVHQPNLGYGYYEVIVKAVAKNDWSTGTAVPIESTLYIDGIRIYNALDPNATENNYRDYYVDGEKDAVFTEIRDMVMEGQAASAQLTDEGFKFGSSTISYTEYVNNKKYDFVGNSVTSVNDYLLAGPNNELYVNENNQALVFYVKVVDPEKTAMLQVAVRNLNNAAFDKFDETPDNSDIPALYLLTAEGYENQLVFGGDKMPGYTEQYHTIDLGKCAKETINGTEYYRVVLMSMSSSAFSMTNLKHSNIEFYTIPGEGASIRYDQYGELVDVVEPVVMSMPNLRKLAWQMQAAAGILPEDELETTDDALKFLAVSLSLKSSIGMNYYVLASDLEGYSAPYITVVKDLLDSNGNVIGTKEYTVTDYEPGTTGGKEVLIFRMDEVFAKEMSANIVATLYATNAEGTKVKGETRVYNPKTYAMNMLSKGTIAPQLRTLLVDMLNYGAAAQVQFNYNNVASNLANADLTAEQLSYGTQTIPELKNYTNSGMNGQEYSSYINGISISLLDSVAVTFYLKVAAGTDLSKLTVRVTYTDSIGVEQTKLLPAPGTGVTTAATQLKFSLTDLTASDMRCILNACAIYDGAVYSNMVTYSIESYAASQLSKAETTESLRNVLVAMMRYGDSTYAYFNSTKPQTNS